MYRRPQHNCRNHQLREWVQRYRLQALGILFVQLKFHHFEFEKQTFSSAFAFFFFVIFWIPGCIFHLTNLDSNPWENVPNSSLSKLDRRMTASFSWDRRSTAFTRGWANPVGGLWAAATPTSATNKIYKNIILFKKLKLLKLNNKYHKEIRTLTSFIMIML